MNFQMNKKTIFILCGLAFFGIVGYRIYSLVTENTFQVFNITRVYKQSGVPVDIMIASKTNGILKEPIYVKNGSAYVSANRLNKFRVGNKVGENGKITSVSHNVDIDTGLYVVRVSGAQGDVFVALEYTGVFVPVSAIQTDGTVLIAKNDIAVPKPVVVIAQDADNAVIKGLENGDKVILSKVEPGMKIKSANE